MLDQFTRGERLYRVRAIMDASEAYLGGKATLLDTVPMLSNFWPLDSQLDRHLQVFRNIDDLTDEPRAAWKQGLRNSDWSPEAAGNEFRKEARDACSALITLLVPVWDELQSNAC